MHISNQKDSTAENKEPNKLGNIIADNAKKKHLLHLLVKKVLITDQHTFEVWYRLPQFPEVRTLGHMVPRASQYANQFAPHEVVFTQVGFPPIIDFKQM